MQVTGIEVRELPPAHAEPAAVRPPPLRSKHYLGEQHAREVRLAFERGVRAGRSLATLSVWLSLGFACGFVWREAVALLLS